MGGGIKRLRITPNQTVWIITLFVLLISIMIGYSALDNNMSINGQSTISTTTLIRISKLELKNSSNNVETSSSVDGNIKGLMETIFTGSGTATFTGTVVNMGSTEAILSTINLLNESNNSSPTCITMSIDGLKVGDTLTPSQEQNFTVTVTSTCTESSTKTNEFSLSYIPVNASGGDTPIEERLEAIETRLSNILEVTYPVGSIYISTSNTNPGDLFGGEWESYATGKTLVGVDTNQTPFNAVNKTGGSSNVTLSTSNLPSHSHTVTAKGTVTSTFSGTQGSTGSAGAHTHTANINGVSIYGSQGFGLNIAGSYANRVVVTVENTNAIKSSSAGAHTHTFTPSGKVTSTFSGSSVTTNSVGSGSAVNVQNPYITVYMWKRTK